SAHVLFSKRFESPPYSAKQLANHTVCTVLNWTRLFLQGAGPSFAKLHVTSASSPVLRRLLCSMTVSLVAFAILMPSAYVSRIRTFFTWRPFVSGAATGGENCQPVPSQMPTFSCSIQTFSIVEFRPHGPSNPCHPPSASLRQVTSPKREKSW